jgi:hypothetical protein
MLKLRLKQWLEVHEPAALPAKPPAALDILRCPKYTMPPLRETPGSAAPDAPPRLPSPTSAAGNQYPSLKSRILMGTNSSKENDDAATELGKRKLSSPRASTTNLAAAAAAATGLHFKRTRRNEGPVASPIRVVRVKDEDLIRPASAARPRPPPKPSLTNPNDSDPVKSEIALAILAAAESLDAAAAADAAAEAEIKEGDASEDPSAEPTDEEMAWKLHQEFNCAPARNSRRGRKSCAQEVAECPAHGADPGILPSC